MFYLNELGMVCALGTDTAAILKKALAGDTTAMRPWEGILPDGASSPFGRVPLEQDAGFAYRCNMMLAAVAGQLAGPVARLKARFGADRIGTVLGTSNATMEEFTLNPVSIDMATPAEFLMRHLGIGGPAFVVSTACSSSAKVFASARRLLANGVCDAVLVGGVDSFSRVVENGFYALESLSVTLTDPMSANRCGINLGEGAALFVMTREPGPVVLLGVGESSDAHHLTAPHPGGRGAAASMRAALADAGLEPGAVDYINLHGTGTVYNDKMESLAVAAVFGDRVPCSSTKPMTGHTLGASGAIEAGLCWLMLSQGAPLLPHVWDGVRDDTLPPIQLVPPGDGRKAKVVLSNSFAFGGSNASVLLGVPASGS
jgi:3-oxoacyl-[acyl-carrier-protein] synthase-1